MIITKALISHFGKFTDRTILFDPGLNVVYGENESGKSTLHRFLTAMLFGMEKQRGKASKQDLYQKYAPWDAPSYYAGALEFSVGNQEFSLKRNFYHKERRAGLLNRRDGEELSVEHGDLEVLLGGIGKRAYENTCCISQAAIETDRDFAESLEHFLVNLSYGGENGVDIGGAVCSLQAKKKKAEQGRKELERERFERLERLRWERGILQADMEGIESRLDGLKRTEWKRTEKEDSLNSIEKTAGKEPQESGKESGALTERRKSAGEHKRTEESAAKHSKLRLWPALLWALAPVLWHVLYSYVLKWDNMPWGLVEPVLWLIPVLWITILLRKKMVDKRSEKNAGHLSDTGHLWEAAESSDSGHLPVTGRCEEKEPLVPSAEAAGRPWELLLEQLAEKQIRLENIDEELEEASKKAPEELVIQEELDALTIAIETIQKVSKELYEDSRDGLYAEISQVFSSLTGGKYDRVELDGGMNMVLYSGSRRLEPWQLSRGTLEQLYFALRLGAGRMMTAEEPLPFLLDEAFCAYDDVRLRRTLKWLAGQKEQVILFTCRKRELELLEQTGIAYQTILL